MIAIGLLRNRNDDKKSKRQAPTNARGNVTSVPGFFQDGTILISAVSVNDDCNFLCSCGDSACHRNLLWITNRVR